MKDHINSVHIKSVKCEFCEYTIAPRRRRRLKLHMQRRHNFPVPPVKQSQIPASTEQPAPETTVPDHQYEQTVSSDIGGTSDVNLWYTYMDLDTPETDAIQLDISTDINFDSLWRIVMTCPLSPFPSQPCWTLLPPVWMRGPLQFYPYSQSLIWMLPHFHLWWQTPPSSGQCT